MNLKILGIILIEYIKMRSTFKCGAFLRVECISFEDLKKLFLENCKGVIRVQRYMTPPPQ